MLSLGAESEGVLLKEEAEEVQRVFKLCRAEMATWLKSPSCSLGHVLFGCRSIPGEVGENAKTSSYVRRFGLARDWFWRVAPNYRKSPKPHPKANRKSMLNQPHSEHKSAPCQRKPTQMHTKPTQGPPSLRAQAALVARSLTHPPTHPPIHPEQLSLHIPW